MTRTVGREHHRALELLERALGYTRGALATVGADRSGPTPCAGWSLADLLCHMDDGLDAFLEAAGGNVRVEVPRGPVSHLEALQGKACHLLGVWSAPAPEYVVVGDHPVPSPLLVSAAALEIAVHGWDVGRATGASRSVASSTLSDRQLMPHPYSATYTKTSSSTPNTRNRTGMVSSDPR